MTAITDFCDEKPERSAVVANCQMNQERGLVGSDRPGLNAPLRPSTDSR